MSDNVWRPPVLAGTMSGSVSVLFLHIAQAVLHVLASSKKDPFASDPQR